MTRNWIAEHLMGAEEAARVLDLHVVQKMYGSTAGPFNGMGASAMTWMVLVCLVFPDRLELFADEKHLGTVPADLRSDLALEYFTPGSPALTQDRLDAFLEEHTA